MIRQLTRFKGTHIHTCNILTMLMYSKNLSRFTLLANHILDALNKNYLMHYIEMLCKLFNNILVKVSNILGDKYLSYVCLANI